MFIYCINYTIFTSKKIAYFRKNKKAGILNYPVLRGSL